MIPIKWRMFWPGAFSTWLSSLGMKSHGSESSAISVQTSSFEGQT